MSWKDELLEEQITKDNIKEIYELTRKRRECAFQVVWDSIIENIGDMDPRIKPTLAELRSKGEGSGLEIHLSSENKTIVYYPEALTILGCDRHVKSPSARMDRGEQYTTIYPLTLYEWSICYIIPLDKTLLCSFGEAHIWKEEDADTLLRNHLMSKPALTDLSVDLVKDDYGKWLEVKEKEPKKRNRMMQIIYSLCYGKS